MLLRKVANIGLRPESPAGATPASLHSSKPPGPKADPQASSDDTTTGLWKLLWPHVQKYKWLVVGAFVFNAAHGVAIAFQTMMPKYLIDWVLTPVGLTQTQRWQRLIILAVEYMFASVVARMLVWHVGYRMMTYVRERVLFGLRAQFFRHVNHLCLRFHIRNQSGELFSYLFGTPLAQVQSYFQILTFNASGSLVIIASTLIWLGTYDWILSVVLLLTVLSTAVLMTSTRKRVQSLFKEYQTTESSVTGYVSDLLRGSRDVKLYAMEKKVAADFDSQVWEVGRKSYERDVRSHMQFMKQETLGYAAFATLCVACAWRYMHDQAYVDPADRLTFGKIMAYLTAFNSLQGAMQQLFQLSTQKGAAQAGLDRINAVLKTASTTPEPVSSKVSVPPRGDISLEEVTFGYTADRPILQGVTMHIPYGQKLALVGPSGAGKSTVTQLMLRLYDPDLGTVRIGGVDLTRCGGSEIRQRFGVVPQDPFIFRTTLKENLCVARPGATEPEMRRACELANAWEFIQKLPDGLETRVGEGGSTLSGGQRQRLAIARALLADPDYFIFDEATSALDTVSEHLVQQAMENSIGGRTALIIAHRLATVKNCDRILVADGGRIAQDGTYDDLVARPGIFRDLVQGQVLRS